MKLMTSFTVFLLAIAAAHAVNIGQPVPGFTLRGSDGKDHKLSDYRGKLVVLEWFNNGCPFVKKYYSEGHMQSLQKRFTGQGVVWLSVVSSAPGKQGHVDRVGAVSLARKNASHQTAILLDPKGVAGKAYSAKTTPHMYLISKDGRLLYQGAIDDNPSTETSDIKSARNYIVEALESSMKGKPVAVASTKPYGCSVKY